MNDDVYCAVMSSLDLGYMFVIDDKAIALMVAASFFFV